MAVNGDTETAKEIAQKGIEVCKSTIELQYAICAITYMENQPKHGEILLRMLLEENYAMHDILFEFYDELKNDANVQRIIAEYN